MRKYVRTLHQLVVLYLDVLSHLLWLIVRDHVLFPTRLTMVRGTYTRFKRLVWSFYDNIQVHCVGVLGQVCLVLMDRQPRYVLQPI
jgi:hypothetical protein